MAIGFDKYWDYPTEEAVTQKVDLTDTELAFEIAAKKIGTLTVFDLHKLNEKYKGKLSLSDKYYGLENLTMIELDELETYLGVVFMFLINGQNHNNEPEIDPPLMIRQGPRPYTTEFGNYFPELTKTVEEIKKYVEDAQLEDTLFYKIYPELKNVHQEVVANMKFGDIEYIKHCIKYFEEEGKIPMCFIVDVEKEQQERLEKQPKKRRKKENKRNNK